ncbi:hypothetical protein VTO42DRAFT_946 [Malbranchea cinnamomea]
MSSKASPAGSTPLLKTPGQQSLPSTPALHQQLQQLHLHQQQDVDTPEETTASFPTPQTFDILPSLHALLERLLPISAKTEETAEPPASGQSPAPGPPAPGSFDPKLLITEASAVKIRIQKARAAIDSLPDIDHTTKEQEKEIAELEEKIARLKRVIGDFGERSTKAMGANSAGR